MLLFISLSLIFPGRFNTFTLHAAFKLFLVVTVIVAIPTSLAVIFPVALTDTTLLLSDSQAYVVSAFAGCNVGTMV